MPTRRSGSVAPMTTTAFDLATHTAADPADMLGAIATLPDQMADGLARARTVREQLEAAWPSDEVATPRTLVVCGMGGSGVGADLLRAAAELQAPMVSVKGYDLPAWVTDEDRVVCCSYSGATAETIACFHQAVERSIVTAVITTGGPLAELARANQVPVVELPSGMQPRAAVGVLFGALAGVAETLHVVRDAGDLVAEAQSGARMVIEENTGTGPERGSDQPPAVEFARQLHDHAVVVYGAAHSEAVAHRWKAQINENSKTPCFANGYPELDHNEILGWTHSHDCGARWALVELMPYAASEPLRSRFDITRRLIGDGVDSVLRFEPRSTNLAAATFELMTWGDYISVHMALLRGIDPSPVDRIQSLKAELGGR